MWYVVNVRGPTAMPAQIAADLGLPALPTHAAARAHVDSLLKLYAASLDAAPGLDKHERCGCLLVTCAQLVP